MTIESVISQIHEEGLRVLNLFERKDGLWQANLYDGEKAWNFGTASTPERALFNALACAESLPGVDLVGNDPRTTSSLLDTLF